MMIRYAALAAGTSLDQLVRLRSPRRRRLAGPALIGAGLVASGTALALVHIVGVDMRTWLAPGQSGLVAGLLETYTAQDSQPEAR
jgi:hypothetical protein